MYISETTTNTFLLKPRDFENRQLRNNSCNKN